MTRGDRLGHSWRAGRLLSSRARLRLRRHDPGRAGAARGHRRARPTSTRALAWQRALDRHYANPDNGGYFLTADDAEGLVVRPQLDRRRSDPQPERARSAQNLVRLAALTGDRRWREQRRPTVRRLAAARGRKPVRPVELLNALDLRLRAAEIVVTGAASTPTRCHGPR